MIYMTTLVTSIIVIIVVIVLMKSLFKDRDDATTEIKKMRNIYEKLEESDEKH